MSRHIDEASTAGSKNEVHADSGQMRGLDSGDDTEDDDTEDISHSLSEEDDEARLSAKATTPIRNNAGDRVDWRAQKEYAIKTLAKLEPALRSRGPRIAVHEGRIDKHRQRIARCERRIALHMKSIDTIKKLGHMVETERQRLEISEGMITAADEFARRRDEAMKWLVDLDKES